jgi:hypothetical protein
MTIPAVALSSIQHYIAKGISKDVAVGIVACLYYESKLNPGAQGSQSSETPGVLNPRGAYGIASWNGPRQKALADFAIKKVESPGLLNTQLDFVLTECANSYPVVWHAIQTYTSYQSFIPVFVNNYEIPADKPKEIAAALAYADEWYPLITAPAALPVVTPTPVPTVPIGVGPMDAALLAQLAPIIEALAAGLFRALISQLSAAPGAAAAGTPVVAAPPAQPAIDLGSLANALVPLLTSQLSTILPNLIAAEVAKIGVKP